MSMNDPMAPRGRFDPERKDTVMSWAIFALVGAAVMGGLVIWAVSLETRTVSTNSPVSTGQGNPAPATPANPNPSR